MAGNFTQKEWDEAKTQARDAMIRKAETLGMITYSDLASQIKSIKVAPNSHHLAKLLGEISTEEHNSGRGMLSVIVVHKEGDMEPGAGFYELANNLGNNTKDRVTFWVSELHKVHNVWSKK
ncbi:hypothetical protein [Oryzibacter oryziterrae]|uniref:hypothetical protein n=1 Tax=Oryzibacter oryziterrae TaxID=2766474 RepID=UPI001F15A8E9|nr:hypothetical protein [Oryzibacter oryziterrae]